MRIYIAQDSAAVSVGADALAAAVTRAAPEATLVRTGARGLYWLEPMLEVESAGARLAFGPLAPDEAAGVLAAVRAGDAARHPRHVGTMDALLAQQGQQRITFARCGVIAPTDWDDFVAHGGGAGLRAARAMAPQAVVDAVKASGLRGRGGAGFPAGIKWQTVKDAASGTKVVVCNADEGDSGTFADRMLMEGDPLTLLEGMAIAAHAVGATRGYIYLRSEYPDARRTLLAALSVARAHGLLGGETGLDIELRIGAGAYIAGEETSLLESLEGKRGQVRAKPPLPAVSGFLGRPTLVNNVMTLATVPAILARGAARYAELGIGRSRGTITLQLSGNVKRPGLYELPFGATLRHLIEGLGGGSSSGRPVRAVQVGGPLGAYLADAQLDTPIGYEEIAQARGMLGHGGVVVFDDSVDMAEQARFAMEFCDAESCGKCTPCRVGSVRAQEVIDRIIAGEQRDANLQLLRELCDTMIHGSLCAHGGMAPFPVLSALDLFPEDFETARSAP
ncbi:MAG: SLBB domain-containing protein [Burkholderiales bacterium]|nr:SLBB domain-containing protein [Burkholderiales bacterium]